MPGGQLGVFTTGPTTDVKLNFGMRWDINPAISFARARAGRRAFSRQINDYLQMGPIRLPIKGVFKALSVINTTISLDFLVGRDATGRWGGFVRAAAGIGQEFGAFSFLDTLEDYVSGFHPLLNGIPTPVVWGDQQVPAREGHYLASGAGWHGLSVAFSDAPTPGDLTAGALAEGFCVYRLPTFEIEGDLFSQQALAFEQFLQRMGLDI